MSDSDARDRIHAVYYPVGVVRPPPARYYRIVALIREFCKQASPKILEIGPERPAVARFVTATLGIDRNDYVGVESSPLSRASLLEAGFRVELADVSEADLPFENSSFDVVLASEVIEHLSNPERMLRSSLRVLKPGGIFIATTPNLAAWYNRVILMLGRQPVFTETGSEWVFGREPFAKPSRPVGHLHLLTPRAFSELVGYCGFRVRRIEGGKSDEMSGRGRIPQAIDKVLSRFTNLSSNLTIIGSRPRD